MPLSVTETEGTTKQRLLPLRHFHIYLHSSIKHVTVICLKFTRHSEIMKMQKRDKIPAHTSAITNYLHVSLTAPKREFKVKSMDPQGVCGSVWKMNLEGGKKVHLLSPSSNHNLASPSIKI